MKVGVAVKKLFVLVIVVFSLCLMFFTGCEVKAEVSLSLKTTTEVADDSNESIVPDTYSTENTETTENGNAQIGTQVPDSALGDGGANTEGGYGELIRP